MNRRMARSGGSVIVKTDSAITETPREGWAVAPEGGESTALGLTITEELKRSGMTVRHH